MSSQKHYPQTIDEAVGVLLASLPEAARKDIIALKFDELISLHFGLGMYIRNHFGLWKDNRALLEATGVQHPDDASMIIIEALWQRLQQNQEKIH